MFKKVFVLLLLFVTSNAFAYDGNEMALALEKRRPVAEPELTLIREIIIATAPTFTQLDSYCKIYPMSGPCVAYRDTYVEKGLDKAFQNYIKKINSVENDKTASV